MDESTPSSGGLPPGFTSKPLAAGDLLSPERLGELCTLLEQTLFEFAADQHSPGAMAHAMMFYAGHMAGSCGVMFDTSKSIFEGVPPFAFGYGAGRAIFLEEAKKHAEAARQARESANEQRIIVPGSPL